MKSLLTWFSALLLSGTLLAQTGTGTAAKDTPPADQAPATVTAEQVKALQDALAAQQKQIDQQQQQIEALRRQLTDSSSSTTAHVTDASLHTTGDMAAAPARAVVSDGPQDEPKESPLSFRIGGAEFTPGGFVDFENVFRTTNLGSNAATSFGAIPFSNTVAGHLTEFRSTGQYSRFNLKVHGKYGANDITGYIEADFNGNDAANTFVTSNSHTNRLRLYWLDLKRGKWEILGGQSYGWLTPNRTGLGPMPADLMLTYSEDANIHVGIPWTRQAAFRVMYHPNDHWAVGLGIENPEQFVGAGEVIFPFAFNAQLGTQFDAANNTGTPNVAPDLLAKASYDNTFGGGRHFHVELGGIMTNVKTTNVPIGGTEFVHHNSTGGGVEFATNFDLFHDSDGRYFRFVANGLWGDGVGRYMIGLGPATVVVPIQTSPTTFDLDTSMVHSGNALAGFEFKPLPKSEFGVYYGGVYFQRNAFGDVTSPIVLGVPIACTTGGVLQTKPCVGFGGINSPNSANRAIQEVTFDWTQTFWKNPQYGAVMLVTQWSYLTRSPWFVAAGAPKNAHLFMSFVSLRYVLP